MKKRVVDTNVSVVANGRNVTASRSCQENAIVFLQEMVSTGCAVLDLDGEIVTEYRKRLFAAGQPGVGDFFYRHLLDNYGNKHRVHRCDVALPRGDALRQAFISGTLANFDSDDRVFALCAAIARVPVVTATDSDWSQHQAGLAACGARVEFICDYG